MCVCVMTNQCDNVSVVSVIFVVTCVGLFGTHIHIGLIHSWDKEG